VDKQKKYENIDFGEEEKNFIPHRCKINKKSVIFLNLPDFANDTIRM
jgi:hypothetical protein